MTSALDKAEGGALGGPAATPLPEGKGKGKSRVDRGRSSARPTSSSP